MLGNAFVATLQADAVGGTSEINSAIMVRIPDRILKEWIEDYDLQNISVEEMNVHYDYLEKAMMVRDTEEWSQGAKNEIVRRGFEAKGWESHALKRAVKGCHGAGDCFTSCPTGEKQTMASSFLPAAMEAGAQVYPLCRADSVIVEGGRARGVQATILDPNTRKPKGSLTVRCKAVVSSAGVFASPLILRRSGVKANGWAGRNLRGHLGVGVTGLFEEEVNGWVGATQGWASNALFHRGLVMEQLWAPPAILLSRLPGHGIDFKKRLKEYKHCSTIAVKPRGVSTGIVREAPDGSPFMLFWVKKADVREITIGMKACIDALFAAGAKEVYPGCHGAPPVLTDPSQSGLMLTRKFRASDFEFAATHVFGTCRIGNNPRKSVVDSWCETHECRDLYVCDSSVLPTGTVNNPQLGTMAFARRAALKMVQRYT